MDRPEPESIEEDDPMAQNVQIPLLINFREYRPPVNGHVQPQPNRPVGEQVQLIVGNQAQLLDLNNQLVNVDNLAELIARHNEPPMNPDELRQLLGVIDVVDEGVEINEDERCNPGDEEPASELDEDDDDDYGGQPQYGEALAAIIYIGMVNKN